MVHLVQRTCTTTEDVVGPKGDHGIGEKSRPNNLVLGGRDMGTWGGLGGHGDEGFQETKGIERQEQLWVWSPMPSTGHFPTERLTCWGHLQSYHYECREFCGLSQMSKNYLLLRCVSGGSTCEGL